MLLKKSRKINSGIFPSFAGAVFSDNNEHGQSDPVFRQRASTTCADRQSLCGGFQPELRQKAKMNQVKRNEQMEQ